MKICLQDTAGLYTPEFYPSILVALNLLLLACVCVRGYMHTTRVEVRGRLSGVVFLLPGMAWWRGFLPIEPPPPANPK